MRRVMRGLMVMPLQWIQPVLSVLRARAQHTRPMPAARIMPGCPSVETTGQSCADEKDDGKEGETAPPATQNEDQRGAAQNSKPGAHVAPQGHGGVRVRTVLSTSAV